MYFSSTSAPSSNASECGTLLISLARPRRVFLGYSALPRPSSLLPRHYAWIFGPLAFNGATGARFLPFASLSTFGLQVPRHGSELTYHLPRNSRHRDSCKHGSNAEADHRFSHTSAPRLALSVTPNPVSPFKVRRSTLTSRSRPDVSSARALQRL